MKEFFKHKRVKWSLIGLGGIIVIVVGLWCLQYLQNKNYLDKYYPDLPCDGIFNRNVPQDIAKLHCKSRCWLDLGGQFAHPRATVGYYCYDAKARKRQAKCLKECEIHPQEDEDRDEYFRCKHLCDPDRGMFR